MWPKFCDQELCHRNKSALFLSYCSLAKEKREMTMSPRNVHDIQIPFSVTEKIFFSVKGKKKNLKCKANVIALKGWVNLKNTVINFAVIKNLIIELCLLT